MLLLELVYNSRYVFYILQEMNKKEKAVTFFQALAIPVSVVGSFVMITFLPPFYCIVIIMIIIYYYYYFYNYY